jgi:hypothetical protein
LDQRLDPLDERLTLTPSGANTLCEEDVQELHGSMLFCAVGNAALIF